MADFDLVVIGGGPGGYVAAIRAAQLGMRALLVEERELGGTCLNRGCIPTKTLLHTAHLAHELSAAAKLGLRTGDVSVDEAAVFARKDEVVSFLRDGVGSLLQANGVETAHGRAFIPDAGTVRVGERTVTTDKILVATGGKPTRLPIPGADLPGVLTSDELLSGAGRHFDRIVIVGGGVIGVEFATVFHAFGTKVAIVEAMDRLLPTADREISQNLQMIFKRRGIEVHTGATVDAFREADGRVVCAFTQRGEQREIDGDSVLVSVGRRPNTDGLFGDGLGLVLERGAVPVAGNFETSVRGVYAIGDVVRGSIQLAHAASAQGLNAVCAMKGLPPQMNLAAMPSCIYTDPEIAAVGMTADDAKREGIPVKTGKCILSANGKNLIAMGDRAFVKVVFHAETGVLLGAQLMCPRATDMIGEFTTAVANGMTVGQLSWSVRAHPTFGEAVGEAVEDAEERAIHAMPKKTRGDERTR